MHNYNEQIIKNGSGRMKRPPLAKNSKAEEVQFLRSSIPLCFCVHIPAPILFWCRYPLVCGYFVALFSGIFIGIGPCSKHFSKSNQIYSRQNLHPSSGRSFVDPCLNWLNWRLIIARYPSTNAPPTPLLGERKPSPDPPTARGAPSSISPSFYSTRLWRTRRFTSGPRQPRSLVCKKCMSHQGP